MILLMLVTAVLITVTGIIYEQKFFVVLPIYVSLFVGLLQTTANRYSLLIGSFNSIIYTVTYVYLGLYATAVSTFFFSCIVQFMTFVLWNKRKYAHSTKFRKLSNKYRVILAVGILVASVAVCFWLDKIGSVYQVLDSLSAVMGAVLPVLTLFAFIEYSWLMLPSGVIVILLYASMLTNNPAQITHVIFSVYSLICVTRGFLSVRRLYKEQQNQKKLEESKEKSTAYLS